MVRLDAQGDEKLEVTRQLAQIEAKARHLSALEWQLMVTGKPDIGTVQELAEVRSKMVADVFALSAQYPDTEGLLGPFYRSYAAYSTGLDEEIRLLQAGDFARAREVDEKSVDPTFDRMMADLERAEKTFAQLAQQAVSRMRVWLLVVLFVSALSLAVLFWRYDLARSREAREKMRSTAALAESEHRFQLISAATNDIFWDWDIGADRVWWNENLSKGLWLRFARRPGGR